MSGAAIPGAVVTVEAVDGNRGTTVTDEEGAFQLLSLPVANYKVKVSARGLSEWTAADVPV